MAASSTRYRVVDRIDSNVVLDRSQLFAVEGKLAQQGFDAAPLIGGQRLCGQPSASHAGEEVRVRAGRGQVPGQNGVHLFFTRVRCFTRWVRRMTWRRRILVRSSATQVRGRKSAANSWAGYGRRPCQS